jgi:hypothetical protein
MDGKDIIKLAADLSAGSITAAAIKETYGEGILSTVAALAGGSIASVVTNSLIDVVDRETGIVSDLGSLVDDVFSIFD